MIYFEIMKASIIVQNSFDIKDSIGIDVTDTDSLVMYTIGNNGICTQTEIVELTNLHKVSVSRSCVKLEHLGLLVRAPHPSDLRMYVLSLTPGGQAALARLSVALGRWESRLMKALGEEPADNIAAAVIHLEAIGLSTLSSHGPRPRPGRQFNLMKFIGE